MLYNTHLPGILFRALGASWIFLPSLPKPQRPLRFWGGGASSSSSDSDSGSSDSEEETCPGRGGVAWGMAWPPGSFFWTVQRSTWFQSSPKNGSKLQTKRNKFNNMLSCINCTLMCIVQFTKCSYTKHSLI